MLLSSAKEWIKRFVARPSSAPHTIETRRRSRQYVLKISFRAMGCIAVALKQL